MYQGMPSDHISPGFTAGEWPGVRSLVRRDSSGVGASSPSGLRSGQLTRPSLLIRHYTREYDHRVAVTCALLLQLFISYVVSSAQESPCAAIHAPEQVAAQLRSLEGYTFGCRVPGPDEPILILLKPGHPDLEAALCSSKGVQSELRKYLCVSPPPDRYVTADVPQSAVMFAWRGLWFIGAYEKGDIDAWLESVATGTIIPSPVMPTGLDISVADLGTYAKQTWALISIGAYDRAREAVRTAWREAEDNPALLGVKHTVFVNLWADLMLADPERTRPYLQTELQHSTLKYRERLGHSPTLADVAELSRLLGQPQVLARAIRDTAEGKVDAGDAFHCIRAVSFDLLYEGNCRGELGEILASGIAEFLSERLKWSDDYGVETTLYYTDKPNEVLAYKKQLTRRCAKLCLEQRDEKQLEGVFETARSNMQWAGVNAVLDECMEAGPPSDVGRRWARGAILAEAAKNALGPGKVTELRAWLGIMLDEPVVAPRPDGSAAGR